MQTKDTFYECLRPQPATPVRPGGRTGHVGRWLMLALTLVLVVAGLLLIGTGCAMTVQKTVTVVPPVWSVRTATNGTVVTNLVSPGKTITTWNRERPLLPPGYAVIFESDTYGVKVNFPTAQNPSPNVIAGIDHASTTWLPTSTNRLHTLKFGKGGTIQNKAVPFWMSTGGWFVTEDDETFTGVDTNGNAFSRVGSPANTNNLTQ